MHRDRSWPLFLDPCCRLPQKAGPAPTPEPAPGPSREEVPAALQAQEFGRKLLGKTVFLQDGKFASADLPSAPEYYLIHWSASW